MSSAAPNGKVESDMPMNMGYCKFENTLAALHECLDTMGDDPDGLSSDRERKSREGLLLLCNKIADDFEDEIEDIKEAREKRRAESRG